MFRLLIFYPAEALPRAMETLSRAGLVEDRLHALLVAHPGCDRIEAHMDDQRLFALDGNGVRMP